MIKKSEHLVDDPIDTKKIRLAPLNQMGNSLMFTHSLLSFDQCKLLSKAIQLGVNSQDNSLRELGQKAKSDFVLSNLKLVRQIVISYSNFYSDIDVEDLFQFGVIGLVRAVEKWDPDREFMFSTYATWWIRQAITRNATDTQNQIRIPAHVQEKLSLVNGYLDNYRDFFGFEPDDLEAADGLDISLNEYLGLKKSIFTFLPLDLQKDESGELFEFDYLRSYIDESTYDPLEIVQKKFLCEQIIAVLNTISNREAGVIAMRFGLVSDYPMTLAEIGEYYGVTRERIRQIESKAMSKLRHPSRSESLKDYLDN